MLTNTLLTDRPRSGEPSPARRPATPLFQPTPDCLRPIASAHDFLVPNPRPDLSLDPRTLRMIERG